MLTGFFSLEQPIRLSRSFIAIPLLMLFVSGCADHDAPLPPRFTTGLTLVAVSEEGKLIDAVAIDANDSATAVAFHLPESMDRMRVMLWGDRIDGSLPRDVYFTASNEAKGGLGFIKVHLQDGSVNSASVDRRSRKVARFGSRTESNNRNSTREVDERCYSPAMASSSCSAQYVFQCFRRYHRQRIPSGNSRIVSRQDRKNAQR